MTRHISTDPYLTLFGAPVTDEQKATLAANGMPYDPLNVYQAWTLYDPFAGRSDDERFLYELGKGATSLVGEGTPWHDQIVAAALVDGKMDAAKLAAVLSSIRRDSADRIADVTASIDGDRATAQAAFRACLELRAATPAIPPADDKSATFVSAIGGALPVAPSQVAPLPSPQPATVLPAEIHADTGALLTAIAPHVSPPAHGWWRELLAKLGHGAAVAGRDAMAAAAAGAVAGLSNSTNEQVHS